MLVAAMMLAFAANPPVAPATVGANDVAPGPSPTYVVRGTITGCTGKHPIVVLLIGSDYFTKHRALKTLVHPPDSVRAGKVTFELRVAPGTYAISAYEDENGNGKLDMGMFGPSEPAQFYRKFTAWRAPRFEDVAFTVDRNLVNADIDLD